jgi:hypothetical protein
MFSAQFISYLNDDNYTAYSVDVPLASVEASVEVIKAKAQLTEPNAHHLPGRLVQ